MKKFTIFIFCLLSSLFIKSQCLNADSLNTTNITYINAQANWNSAPNAYHYKIHYREIGTSNWSNLGNIDSTMTSRLIPLLQPLTTYQWEIEAFCDSTFQNGSGWSYSDTFTTTIFVPCLNADSLYINSITHENAIANWNSAPNAYHYKIHYREIGTSNWSNLGNIDSTMTSRLIPLLQPLTTYQWEIEAFCDSTFQNGSGWSYSDTFTTAAFIPAPFAPSILPIIANFTCNMNTAFSIIAQQQQNEPDISSSIFWSDKGYFEINTLSSGDTLGNASYSSPTHNINSVLVLDFKLGPNYAKIDMIDSVGGTMGFFIIENMTSGIKVTTLGPNDVNNYTSGYISQINFIDLFVNPDEEGPITFTADINSELGDVIQEIDSSIIIICPATNIEGIEEEDKLWKIVDVFGREVKKKRNTPLLYIYENGTVEKKIIIRDN